MPGGELRRVVGSTCGREICGLVFCPQPLDVAADLRPVGGGIGHAVANEFERMDFPFQCIKLFFQSFAQRAAQPGQGLE